MARTIETTGETCSTPGLQACKDTGMVGQFGHPHGFAGRLVGHLMARKNWQMNQYAVEVLDVQPDDQLLEIGFGHGRTVHAIAERATNGRVAGVDISATMLEQASKRNADLIAEGRVELRQASVERLPFPDGAFDKALASNNVQFWPAPVENAREVGRVLRNGGTLVLGLRMEHPTRRRFVAPGFTDAEIDEIEHIVSAAGFRDVRTTSRHFEREIRCLLATK